MMMRMTITMMESDEDDHRGHDGAHIAFRPLWGVR